MIANVTARIAVSSLVVAVLSALVGTTFARFSNTAVTASNSYAAGTVTIGDNATGAAVVSMVAAKPGDSRVGCIRVEYDGSLPAGVRLYAQTSGPLASALQLTVTRGSDPTPAFNSCTGFVADQTNYTGAGPGVVYSGSLDAYPGSYSTGLVDPYAAAPESWTKDEPHSYRYEVVFNGGAANQGQSATATFVWEARGT